MDPSGRTSRQDACPGALQVHRAEDGNLARVRIPAGALRGGQLRALSDAAVRLGDGHLELTSRGNLQLRGLRPGAETELAGLLRAADLLPSVTHERVRNIMASILTGRDGSGHLDIRPLVDDLDRQLCADPLLAQLSGRFLFTVDDGRDDVSGLSGDIGLLATGRDTVALLLAGEDSGLRARTDAAAALALGAARAFLAWCDAHDSAAWRLAELDPAAREACARTVATDPGAGPLWRADSLVPSYRPPHRPVVGVLGQLDSLVAICAAVPLGRLNADQAEALWQSARDGSGETRITPWRTVVVPDLSGDAARRWSKVFGDAGLLLDRTSALIDVSACAGRPGCGRSLADVRGDAVRTHTAASTGAVLRVHWSGCERGCGRPAGRHVQVRAVPDGYQVGLDGEPGTLVANTGGETDLARLPGVVAARRSGS